MGHCDLCMSRWKSSGFVRRAHTKWLHFEVGTPKNNRTRPATDDSIVDQFFFLRNFLLFTERSFLHSPLLPLHTDQASLCDHSNSSYFIKLRLADTATHHTSPHFETLSQTSSNSKHESKREYFLGSRMRSAKSHFAAGSRSPCACADRTRSKLA